MSLQIRIKSDTLTPDLIKKIKAMSDRKPILEAMGTQLVSLTKRAFNDSTLRAAAWPPKKDGTPATLKKSGALWQSIRITGLTNTYVTVGSDRPYAAIHQLGSKKPGRMPMRPFFPVLNGQLTDTARAKIIGIAKAKVQSLLK